jgi:hypothetical protein
MARHLLYPNPLPGMGFFQTLLVKSACFPETCQAQEILCDKQKALDLTGGFAI